MKNTLLSTLVLGSTVALAACGYNSSANDLDGALTQAPYSEERTIGASGNTVTMKAPTASVKSAEPVFESSQVK